MNDITEPLRLAVGSHSAGSGKGCAMNLISWENGDTTITDLPGCSDPMLARIVTEDQRQYLHAPRRRPAVPGLLTHGSSSWPTAPSAPAHSR